MMEREGSRARYSQLSPLVLIMELKNLVFQSCLGLVFPHYALILPIGMVVNIIRRAVDWNFAICLLIPNSQRRVWPFEMLRLKVWKLLSLD